MRRTLWANALFTTLCGLALVLAAGPLSVFIGGVGVIVLRVVGGVLLLYAVDLARTAVARPIPQGRIAYFIAMDLLWVVGSAVVLWGLAVPFTPAGWWSVLLVADAVALFGMLQYLGLRRLTKPGVEAAPSV